MGNDFTVITTLMEAPVTMFDPAITAADVSNLTGIS
jgi:hypothetical protein